MSSGNGTGLGPLVALFALDFGGTGKIGNNYGASAFGRPLTTSEIRQAIANYARGWFLATRPNMKVNLKLYIGISNNIPSAMTPAHGKAWSQMIAQVNIDLKASGYASQIFAEGGVDVEAPWSTPSTVKAWLSGFGSGPFANFGDANTCPGDGKSITKPGANCAGQGWTQDDIVAVSGTTVLPGIYANSGYNAKQWQTLSLYKVTKIKV